MITIERENQITNTKNKEKKLMSDNFTRIKRLEKMNDLKYHSFSRFWETNNFFVYFIFFINIALTLDLVKTKRNFLTDQQTARLLNTTVNIFTTPFPSMHLKKLTLFFLQGSQPITIKDWDFSQG